MCREKVKGSVVKKRRFPEAREAEGEGEERRQGPEGKQRGRQSEERVKRDSRRRKEKGVVAE